eukprot:2284829-Prymnesium_polylepis.1
MCPPPCSPVPERCSSFINVGTQHFSLGRSGKSERGPPCSKARAVSSSDKIRHLVHRHCPLAASRPVPVGPRAQGR